MHSLFKSACVTALLAFTTPALADSISPSSYANTIHIGDTLSLGKTVNVSAGTPTTAQADIFFLTDTTGSMGSTIDAVKSNFGAIASSVSGNIAYGVGEFKDEGEAYIYKQNSDISTDVSAAQSAIDSWSASGGGDFDEQGLYALGQAATTTSWRDGSKKIVLLAGDASSHENLDTVESAAATLVANGVTVESIDVGNLNYTGQFSGPDSIYANGVAGQYFTSFGDDLVAQIQAAIGSAFSNYSSVALQIVGGAGLDVAFAPAGITGSFDRSIDRAFDFDLSVTGLTAGTHSYTINALVDGGIIASATDTITVLDNGPSVPEPATWAMMITGFGMVGTALRRRTSLVPQSV